MAKPDQGSLSLLDDPAAQRLLTSQQLAHLAYNWTDGTPRCTPIWFHWNGSEVAMASPATAPKHLALHDGDSVAVTIDDPSVAVLGIVDPGLGAGRRGRRRRPRVPRGCRSVLRGGAGQRLVRSAAANEHASLPGHARMGRSAGLRRHAPDDQFLGHSHVGRLTRLSSPRQLRWHAHSSTRTLAS